jgi:hypothetical protein
MLDLPRRFPFALDTSPLGLNFLINTDVTSVSSNHRLAISPPNSHTITVSTLRDGKIAVKKRTEWVTSETNEFYSRKKTRLHAA